jgi:hemin uptake protein HemP
MTLNPAASDTLSAQDMDFSMPTTLIRSVSRAAPRVCITSEDLLQGGRELVIQHGEHEYRLRLTQNDKLILTK